MNFLHGLSLESFRLYTSRQDFSFQPITLFTGPNNSGKSTVSQAVKILSQHFNRPIVKMQHLGFNKPLAFQLDDFLLLKPLGISEQGGAVFNPAFLVPDQKEGGMIKLTVPVVIQSYPEKTELRMAYQLSADNLPAGILTELTIVDMAEGQVLFQISLSQKAGRALRVQDTLSYNYQVNYRAFYAAYLLKRKQYQDLVAVVKAVRACEKTNTKKLRQLNTQCDILAKQLTGDVRVKFSNTEALKSLEYHGRVAEQGIEGSFTWERKAVERQFLYLNKFIGEHLQPFSLLDAQWALTLEQRFHVYEAALDTYEKDTMPAAMEDAVNLTLLDRMSAVPQRCVERQPHYLSSLSSEMDIINPTTTCIKVCKEHLELDLNPLIQPTSVLEGFDRHFFLNQQFSIFSKEAQKFFKEFVWAELVQAFQALEFLGRVHFYDKSNSNYQQRVHLLNSQAVGSSVLQDFYQSWKDMPDPLVRFFKKWITELDIADDVVIEKMETAFSIFLLKGNQRLNLADEGAGVSRLLPLLMRVCSLACNGFKNGWNKETNEPSPNFSATLIIEEPEIGLHPSLQSKLAGFIYEAYTQFNIQFIVETHSEYLIRRFQVLAAQAEIDPELIQIYYCTHPEKALSGTLQAYPITIDHEGSLSQPFGQGFFDEAANLNIALYLSSRHQRN